MTRIRVEHECTACKGYGIYSGMGESDGAAVVCRLCRGSGMAVSWFEEFHGRKEKDGIVRVYEANPGIKIGSNESRGLTLEDFGGMPYDKWLCGYRFTLDMADKLHTCPAWWAQCVPGMELHKPDWDECAGPGCRFSKCEHFANKAKCWERYEAERKAVGR